MIAILWALHAGIGIALWPWFARLTLAWGVPYKDSRDSEDYVIAGLLSLIGAAAWPVVFTIAGIAWVIRHPLRRYLFGGDR